MATLLALVSPPRDIADVFGEGGFNLSDAVSKDSMGGIVTAKQLEDHLRSIEASGKNPRDGVFGPQSMEWRINGEAAVFLGAGRALLLQLAHPMIAAAVADHSSVFADPVGRFHRTFQLVFTLVFGTVQEALSASRHLHSRHALINGVLTEPIGPFARGTSYTANDAETCCGSMPRSLRLRF